MLLRFSRWRRRFSVDWFVVVVVLTTLALILFAFYKAETANACAVAPQAHAAQSPTGGAEYPESGGMPYKPSPVQGTKVVAKLSEAPHDLAYEATASLSIPGPGPFNWSQAQLHPRMQQYNRRLKRWRPYRTSVHRYVVAKEHFDDGSVRTSIRLIESIEEVSEKVQRTPLRVRAVFYVSDVDGTTLYRKVKFKYLRC